MNFCGGRLSRPDNLIPPPGSRLARRPVVQGDRTDKERAVSARRPVLPVAAGGGESGRLSKMQKKDSISAHSGTLANPDGRNGKSTPIGCRKRVKSGWLAPPCRAGTALRLFGASACPAVVGRGKTVGGGANLSRQSFN